MDFEVKIFVLIASALYVLMGSVHCLVALWDQYRGLLFMQRNDTLREDLKVTRVWFAPQASLLSTLEGLNLSHGLGVMIFGLATLGFTITGIGTEHTVELLLGSTFFAVTYLAVALRYWTGVPAAGYGVGVTLLGIACLQHWL